ncbi:MAG TPA: hypothetical protein VHW64_15980, partial [Nocardioides sp.]|uniref:hypothetical protein n=1 Tax=Nocardioides sp. TaxID=35761 RepID=UPI002E316587
SARWHPSWRLGAPLAAVLAMTGGNAPMAVLDVTDPRSWSPTDWLADALPHAAFGVVTATALHLMDWQGRGSAESPPGSR